MAAQSVAAPVTHAVYPSHEKSSPINSWTAQDVDAWLDKHNLRHLASVYVRSYLLSVQLFSSLVVLGTGTGT